MSDTTLLWCDITRDEERVTCSRLLKSDNATSDRMGLGMRLGSSEGVLREIGEGTADSDSIGEYKVRGPSAKRVLAFCDEGIA